MKLINQFPNHICSAIALLLLTVLYSSCANKLLNMKTKSTVRKSLLILMILIIFASCVMDRTTPYYIKNCTKDSLLIELSKSDTLANWQYWSAQGENVMLQKNTDDALYKAVVGSLALPDSTIRVNPFLFQRNDSCYIYTIKWSVAKNYSMDEIRANNLYDRQIVTEKQFHDHIFDYKKDQRDQ